MKDLAKILIANRGEIAVRVMRTCRAMGISSVAVYSDADARALHTTFADEAVHIGPAPARDSYLNIERIIDAAKRTGAGAIHPGYGFLSENAEFAEACERAGITFIGPTPEAIRNMGSKSTARKLIAAAGVPIVPGYSEDQSLEAVTRNALAMGFPILIKASAGGGGKGMRVVRDQSELQTAIESANREAEKAFGDGTLLLERFIDGARHVEVQILGDDFGNILHLFERECSIQRRHQKVIEESPSTAMSVDLRRRICEAAVAAARAIGYTNAGTVEFILDSTGDFYFIEVNTRLQVEHPVTEMTTGLDLVRLQIEIAAGKQMTLTQEDITQTGHAIEVRLYAEDPENNFLPATGTLLDWDAPANLEGLRIDSGVERGAEIGIHYDPLLAKVISHGPDRETARKKLVRALGDLAASGVRTNCEFLIRALEHPEFANGSYHTGFIGLHLDELIGREDKAGDLETAAVIAIYLLSRQREDASILPDLPPGYRNNPFRDPSIKLQMGVNVFDISWRPVDRDTFLISCGDWQANVQLVSFDRASVRASIDGIQKLFRIAEAGHRFFVHSRGRSRVIERLPRHPAPNTASEHQSAFAPMPGQVLKILVSVGQSISVGDPLVILEAMKMEQTLRAQTDGIVEAVLVKQGDVVAPGDTLVQIAAKTAD